MKEIKMNQESEETINKIKTINEINNKLNSLNTYFNFVIPILLIIFIFAESIWSKNFHFGAFEIILITVIFLLYRHQKFLTEKIIETLEQNSGKKL